MGLYALPVSILLLFTIIMVEALRKKPGCYIDFLSLVNLMFIVLFFITPFYLLLLNPSNGMNNSYWLFKNSFTDSAFLYASICAFIGYISLLYGYYFKQTTSGINTINITKNASDHASPALRDSHLLISGTVLGLIGTLSFAYYAYSIGGIVVMIKLAAAFRGDEPPTITRYAFLKNVSPLLIVSSYFFFALIQSANSHIKRFITMTLFSTTFILSLLVLFHDSGRLQLFAYLSIFPVSKMIQMDRIQWKLAISYTALFILIILFGKELFHYFINPNSIASKATAVIDNPISSVHYILREFTFPYVTLANTVKIVPDEVMYRWFYDIPLSFVYLLPQRLLELKDLPPTVTMVNVMQFDAPIPVDLMSFAYFSLGLPGIFIVCFIYGYFLKYFNNFLPASGAPIYVIFRTAWIMFFAINIMYGNPHHALVNGFPLLVATAILYIIKKFQKIDVNYRATDGRPMSC